MSVEISDAQPVQYWLNGKETFNQKQPAFINKRCFFQIFKCDRPIPSQFIDTVLDKTYLLQIFDKNGEGLASLPFIKSYLYGGEPLQFEDQTFPVDMGSWVNLDGAPSPPAGSGIWEWGTNGTEGFANAVGVGITLSSDTTRYLSAPREDGFDWPAGKYIISITVSHHSDTGVFTDLLRMSVHGLPDATHHTQIITGFDFAPNNGAKYTQIVEFTTSQPWKYLAFKFEILGGSLSAIDARVYEATIIDSPGKETAAVHKATFTPNAIEPNLCETKFQLKIADGDDPETVIAYSDFLIATSSIVNGPFSGAVEIKYRSFYNVFGMVYGPDSDFNYLYIVSRFFHNDEPVRQKIVELSDDDTVVTSTGLTQQRTLTIGDCPDYLHQKLKLALQHAASGEVEIDDENWILLSYAKKLRSAEEYPFKPAECILINRKYLKRNLI